VHVCVGVEGRAVLWAARDPSSCLLLLLVSKSAMLRVVAGVGRVHRDDVQ